jgi:hypothetical protein
MYETTKYWQLVKSVLEKTTSGRVKWEELTDSVYITYLSKSAVAIRQVGEDITMDIMDDNGNLADSFTDVDLKDVAMAEGAASYETMKELLAMARRAAKGVDKLLDDLLGELGKE